jgi:hypothetical protein
VLSHTLENHLRHSGWLQIPVWRCHQQLTQWTSKNIVQSRPQKGPWFNTRTVTKKTLLILFQASHAPANDLSTPPTSRSATREGSPDSAFEKPLDLQVALYFSSVSPGGFPDSQSEKKAQPWKRVWRPGPQVSKDEKLIVACPKPCVFGTFRFYDVLQEFVRVALLEKRSSLALDNVKYISCHS